MSNFKVISVLAAIAIFIISGEGKKVKKLNIDNVLSSDGIFEGQSLSLPAIGGLDVGQAVSKFSVMLNEPGKLDKAYNNYAAKYSKSSTNDARKEVFKATALEVFEHNLNEKNGLATFTMGINKFSDMTLDEVKAEYTGVILPNSTDISQTSPNLPSMAHRFTRQVAESKDWRQGGYVTSVKNQGQCGSCTLFALTAQLEANYAIYKKKKNLDLSEQELLDCAEGDGVGRCQGNAYPPIYDYQKKGQTTEDQYKYTAKSGTCKGNGKSKAAKIASYNMVSSGSEEDLKTSVGKNGPTTIIMTLNNEFKSYKSGIMNTPCESKSWDHALLAVGYGSQDGQDYWIIKNSWGASWGDKGYIKVGRGQNLCRVSDYGFFAPV